MNVHPPLTPPSPIPGKIQFPISKAGRTAVKQDASLSSEDKKKTAAFNEEIFGKIKALMTPEQYAKWEKLQAAIRAGRAK